MREKPNDFKLNLDEKMEAGWSEVVGHHLKNIFYDGTNDEAQNVYDLYILKKKILENTSVPKPDKRFRIG